MSGTQPGALAIILHAHLPLVRHPENAFHLEELWFFEAMAECYLPLIGMLERLEQDGIPGVLTLSLSPTLLTMMDDPFLKRRFETYLEQRLQLCRQEFDRTEEETTFHRLSGWYMGWYEGLLEDFQDVLHRDVASALGDLHRRGRVELITCAGTHPLLPLVHQPEVRQAHVNLAVDLFRERFADSPQGLWLPECAYTSALNPILADQGIRYVILEDHALSVDAPELGNGLYTPCTSDQGTAFFARDTLSGQQVWSATQGYPGDPEYREFYRDIGFDLDVEAIKPFIHPDGIRVHTGLKYYRITSASQLKEPYEPDLAQAKAAQHAQHFVGQRIEHLAELSRRVALPPLIVSAYDAELFGHWWFEGPLFLEHLFRHAAQEGLEITSPGRYLDRNPILPVGQPIDSTWGYRGTFEAWLNEDTNAWMVRYLHSAEERFCGVLSLYRGRLSEAKEAILAQAARELMLAQSSDWAFIINTGTTVEYAVHRFQDHLQALHRLLDMAITGKLDREFLAARRQQWPVFPTLDLEAFVMQVSGSRSQGGIAASAAPPHPLAS